MRDDDDIRLYMPVLQRIIILVAVIIAVPVMLWTITAFVRTYVGPPQLPTFQRVTAVEQSDNSAGNPQIESASHPTPSSTASNRASNPPGSILVPMQTPASSAPPVSDQAANMPAAAPPIAVASAPQ